MTRSTHQRGLAGFTLIEVLVASTVFIFVAVIALTAYISIYSANRRANAERLLIDETAYLMERLVKDIRNGQIDFPEYRRWSSVRSNTPVGYTTPPDPEIREYYEERYETQSPAALSGLEAIVGTEDCTDAFDCSGADLAGTVFPGLVILSPEGDRRLRFRRVVVPDSEERAGEGILQFAEERLVESAGEWYWVDGGACAPVTACPPPIFYDLSSEDTDVVAFRFQITPLRDPFFAYEDLNVQQQPMVLLRLQMRTSPLAPHGAGELPSVDVTTAVSIRAYGEATWTPIITP